MRVDFTRPRGVSSDAIPPPPSSTGVDTVEASGAAAANADVPPPTTSDDSDIRRMLDHVLTVRQLMDKFWWTCSMRSVACAQSWHSFDDPHHHLLLMMNFDCPLAFCHKKGEYF